MNNALHYLNEIATSVIYAAEGRDVERVLERIAEVSRQLVKARYAALGVPDGQGGLKYFKVAGMTPEEVEQLEHLPRGRGMIGAIMEERKPIRLARMQDDPRSVGFCRNHPHMTSLLGVPILVGQQLFGVLYLCDRADSQPFDEQDQWLIETTAGYAALAIAGSQLAEQQSRVTILEERERIGMELHDGVIQSLYALGMHVELLRTADSVQPSDLTPVVDGLNQVIEDIRHYILNLKTASHRQVTVYECLEEMLERLHVPESLSVEIEAPQEPPPFSPAVFQGICQIANEAISNAVRHADASRLHIAARQTDHYFQIVIADNGKGFNLDSTARQRGLGLRNIHQRARLHGGEIRIDTAPERGTTITINIPC